MQSYLSERQQRTKVNNAYSTYSDILYGFPQGSILGPLLFSIYISNMFHDIASYADNNTPYISDFNLEEVIQKLELATNNLFEWFKNNHMKAIADKCHLVLIWDTDVAAKIGEFDVKNSSEEKLLGVKIGSKLSFENHVSSLCKKESQKLHAFQFNYCPLIWMFHSRQLNNRITRYRKEL